MSTATFEGTEPITQQKLSKSERAEQRAERAREHAKIKAEKKAAYAPVQFARKEYYSVGSQFSRTSPEFLSVLKRYRDALASYEEFLFQRYGLDVVDSAHETEILRASSVANFGFGHVTLEHLRAVGIGAGAGVLTHTGGAAALTIVGTGIAVGAGTSLVIEKVDKDIEEVFSKKEKNAREKGMSLSDFRKEHKSLLVQRAESIKKRKYARMATRYVLTGGTVLFTGAVSADHMGHSLGQMLSSWVREQIHTLGVNDSTANYLADGNGMYQKAVHAIGSAVGSVWNEFLGAKDAGAAPLPPGGVHPSELPGNGGGTPEVGRTQLITHFGSAPWARSLTEALNPRSISEAADVLIRGGMNPEAREEFIAAANAFRNNQSPEFVDFTRREWEAQAFRTRGVPSVLGDGVDRVLFDASREPGFRGEHPPVYRALKMPFSYTDARGVLHEVMVEIPIGKADGSGEQDCYNFSLYSDSTVVTPPPTPEAFVPPPTPERPVLVVPRVIWSEQSGFVASDCTSCGPEMKITNLRILEYRGESLEEARQYMIAALSERSAWVDYQRNMDYKFVYLRFHNNLTGVDTFHCLNLENNQFSQPTIVTDRGTEVVRTAEQFDGLVTGTSEEWKMTGSARSARGSDISVLSPKDPMPLFAVDPDGDGRPNRFVPGMDINGNGILEANEIGRTLNDVVDNQMYLIGNDIIPQEGGSPDAQAVLERTFLSRIPEAFIQGRTEGARFAALKAEFGGILSDEQIRELGRWLHFYEELHTTPAHPDGAAAYRNSDGSPKVIFQFLREGITETARPQNGSVGDFPDLRRAQ